MRKNLSIDDLGNLLELPILAVLATRRKNGEILLSPVCHEWADGELLFTVYAGDVKSRHIQNDPKITMLIAETDHPLRGVQISGEAILDPDADATELMRRLGARYSGDVGQDDFAGAYEQGALEVVRLRPSDIRAWDFSDEY
jgi:PPOX class probable F420-dependent enzyme